MIHLPDFPDQGTQGVEPILRWQFHGRVSGDEVSSVLGNELLHADQPLIVQDRALLLDGQQWLATDLEQPDLPPMPASISLTAWVNIEANNPIWVSFVGGLQDNGNYERGFMLGMNRGEAVFGIAGSATKRLTYLRSGSQLSTSQWHFVAGTYDERSMRLYLNGKLKAVSTAQTGSLLSDPASWLSIGAYKDDDEFYPMKGKIRQVSLWRGALSAQDIRELYLQAP